MLESAADEPLAAQAETFKRILEAYRGDRKQRDDIAMIGFSM